MKFKEINDIIDYYRSQGCIIIKHYYDHNMIVIETPNAIQRIRYQIHWETNGEYYYKIL